MSDELFIRKEVGRSLPFDNDPVCEHSSSFLVPDPRDATISQLQAELERMRETTLREAAKIVRERADFGLPDIAKEMRHKPPWHRFAYECAYTLEQIATRAALGGSND